MKNVFYRVYNAANIQRFTEMSAKKLMHDFDTIDSDFDSGKNSRFLMKKGALLQIILKTEGIFILIITLTSLSTQ